jgi:ubiquinone/menaquinone biosynthesis C-methylase UbiE
MEHTHGAVTKDTTRVYESWRNKYANEKDRCADYDDRYAGRSNRRWSNWQDGRMVRKALKGLPANALVLDSPCGGGRIARSLEREGRRVVVADYSQFMVGESMPGAAAGVRLDAMRLPFRDDAFDAAVCFRFLHSVPPAMRPHAIRELARVAKVLVLNYLNAFSIRNLRRFLFHGRQLTKRVTEPQAIAEVESAGLEVTACVYKYRLLFEDFVVVARKRVMTLLVALMCSGVAISDFIEM